MNPANLPHWPNPIFTKFAAAIKLRDSATQCAAATKNVKTSFPYGKQTGNTLVKTTQTLRQYFVMKIHTLWQLIQKEVSKKRPRTRANSASRALALRLVTFSYLKSRLKLRRHENSNYHRKRFLQNPNFPNFSRPRLDSKHCNENKRSLLPTSWHNGLCSKICRRQYRRLRLYHRIRCQRCNSCFVIQAKLFSFLQSPSSK